MVKSRIVVLTLIGKKNSANRELIEEIFKDSFCGKSYRVHVIHADENCSQTVQLLKQKSERTQTHLFFHQTYTGENRQTSIKKITQQLPGLDASFHAITPKDKKQPVVRLQGRPFSTNEILNGKLITMTN
jgi:hypothetical protein